MRFEKPCPDCDSTPPDRRDFLKTAAGAAMAGAAVLGAPMSVVRAAPPTASSAAEQALVALYATLTNMQKRDRLLRLGPHADGRRQPRPAPHACLQQLADHSGRTSTATSTPPHQKRILFDIFKGIIHPDWHTRIQRQLRDDTEGVPGERPSRSPSSADPDPTSTRMRDDGPAHDDPLRRQHDAECRLRRPHLLRPCRQRLQRDDRPSRQRLLEPGPAGELRLPDARRSTEASRHGGTPARRGGGRLPRRQRAVPRVCRSATCRRPEGRASPRAGMPGRAVSPGRPRRRDGCLQRQGRSDRCSLAFYRDGDIGNDGEWDNWRLEGPAFVWYYRGHPHVHVWVNIADDPSVTLNGGDDDSVI